MADTGPKLAQKAPTGAAVPRMTTFEPAHLDHASQYKLLSGTVIPRPIALVTTLGRQGGNAAPFSFFNVLGVEPPMVMFSVGMRGGRAKDTLANLRRLPELVVHIVDDANAQRMNLCGADYPPEVDEIEVVGFETVSAVKVQPPRIVSCPVQFECVARHIMPFGTVPYHLVIAEVVLMHLREDIVNASCRVDPQRLAPIGRLAGPGMYTRITDQFVLPAAGVPTA